MLPTCSYLSLQITLSSDCKLYSAVVLGVKAQKYTEYG